jgi:predicted transposase/invertase (TIGR01784 family)
MNKPKLLPKPKIGTFIDPLSDYGFKFLFGREPCKDLLIDFLNEIFKGRKVITDLTYNKNEHSGPGPMSRKMIFDLTCTGQDGEQFIIEVQRIRQDNFKDRAVYYSSRLIHDQAPQGGIWDYSLKEVYFIGIMDFIFEETDKNEYLHWARLAYEKSGKEFYKKLRYIFIEIPKFTKEEKQLKTGIDKWLFLLKNLSRLQKIPLILNTRIFSKLFQIAKVSNLNKEEYMKYEKDLMASWDEYSIRKTIENERKTAVERAMKEGREEGREEGIEKKSYEVVKNLLSIGKFTIAEIANFASVSEFFVRKVKKGEK